MFLMITGSRQTIIDVLTNLNNEQRQDVMRLYKEQTQQDLIENIKKALSGDLENVIVGLLKTPIAYDVQELKSAMKGLGTDEATLTEIICTRSNERLKEIQNICRQEFKAELETNIISDTSESYSGLLLAITKILSELGPKKTPIVSKWITIMAERSPRHLRRDSCPVLIYRGRPLGTDQGKKDP
ncbi:annexin A2 [Pelobates cultripes]|uniref:Annexin A2, partial n=1 Tax=Pelobates cultripes TaxID=61616 RepID=A0AAD1WSJ2_PELCU|nr:annexin A2 [Pelobates cultripes]